MGGYRVLEASGAQQATHIADDPSVIIDLLLTDVVMPGMSGPDLARQVCQSRPGLVTLFMTGYAESEILRTATYGACAEPHPEAVYGRRSPIARGRRSGRAMAQRRRVSISAIPRPLTSPPRGPGFRRTTTVRRELGPPASGGHFPSRERRAQGDVWRECRWFRRIDFIHSYLRDPHARMTYNEVYGTRLGEQISGSPDRRVKFSQAARNPSGNHRKTITEPDQASRSSAVAQPCRAAIGAQHEPALHRTDAAHAGGLGQADRRAIELISATRWLRQSRYCLNAGSETASGRGFHSSE